MAQRSPLPTNIHGCRQILGGTHARKRRADSRCRNSLAQFFLSAGGSIRVSAVAKGSSATCAERIEATLAACWGPMLVARWLWRELGLENILDGLVPKTSS